MDMQLLKEIVDYGVIGILAFMSIIVLWFGIERIAFIKEIDISRYGSRRQLEIDISKRLTTIATIGSNAPYVGLLGTVIAIMLTFLSIGENGIESGNSLMSGLALALKATAAGLVVAIPSIMIYNYLLRKVEVALMEWDILNEEN